MSNNLKTKEVYKDLINWKVYNYLLDKLTIFEDKGHDVDIGISVPVIEDGKYDYAYSNVIFGYNTLDTRCEGGEGVYYIFYEEDYEKYLSERRLVFVVGFFRDDYLEDFKKMLSNDRVIGNKLMEIKCTNAYAVVYEYME